MAKSEIDKLLDEKKEENDEEIGATKWEPEAGEKLSGAIQKVGWYDGGEYSPQLYLIFKEFETDATHRVYAKTVLMNQLLEEKPAIGQHIVMRYDGKVQGAKRKYHGFTLVLVPDENGSVKRDPQFWHQNGVYRGSSEGTGTNAPLREEPDGGFF